MSVLAHCCNKMPEAGSSKKKKKKRPIQFPSMETEEHGIHICLSLERASWQVVS